MAFLAQLDDGTIDNANSHVTVQEYYNYTTDRGYDYTDLTDYPTLKIQAAAIKATDYINNQFRYVSIQVNEDQGTAFPRDYVYDLAANQIEAIPVPVKQDTYELMRYLLDNPSEELYDDIDAESAGVKSYKDSISSGLFDEKEYFGSVKYNSKVIGLASNIKRCGYLIASGSSEGSLYI